MLLAGLAVFLFYREVVHDRLPLQVPRKRLPTRPFLGNGITGGTSGGTVVVIAGVFGLWGFRGCLPCLPGTGEKHQLVRGKLLALAVALGIQQLP